MKNWYNSLNPRERNLVFYGSIVATILVIGLFIVQPLMDKNKKLHKTIANQKSSLKVMQKQSLQVKQLQQQGSNKTTPSSNKSPQQKIETALQTMRLKPALERMQSQGSNSVRIILKDANADRTMRLLSDLETKHGLLIDNLVVNTNNKEAGLIDARITVKSN